MKRLCAYFLAFSMLMALPAIAATTGHAVKKGEPNQAFQNAEGPVFSVDLSASLAGNSQSLKSQPTVEISIDHLLDAKHLSLSAALTDRGGSCSHDRELLWLKGVSLDVTGQDGKDEPLKSVDIRESIEVDINTRNKLFLEATAAKERHLLTLSRGEHSVIFPAGLGVPVATDERWTFNFTPAEASKLPPECKVKCTLYFIKDIDLIYPIKSLEWMPAKTAGSARFIAGGSAFIKDDKFARPDWRYKPQKGDAPFCGVKSHTDEVPQPTIGNQPPLFDPAKDGPLLKEAKKLTLVTSEGKINILLDPTKAPLSATQLYKLLKNKAFDGTGIDRYEAGFVLQVNLADGKVAGWPPLTDSQKALVRKLPLETDCQKDGSVKHKQWVLSMAREDNDLNSSTTSFSILLGDAPHLDTKYTIFGAVLPDQDSASTLDRIAKGWHTRHPWIVTVEEL